MRGIGQSVSDTLCRHRAPNPFVGGFTNLWESFLQIPVIACLCVSLYLPLCKSVGGCRENPRSLSPGYIRRPTATCPQRVLRFLGQYESTTAPLGFPMRPKDDLPGDSDGGIRE